MTDYFDMKLVGEAADCALAVTNIGIDSRLEGFTKSSFEWRVRLGWDKTVTRQEYFEKYGHIPFEDRPPAFAEELYCLIHPDELQILIRRLCELKEGEDWEEAGMLAEDIVNAQWREDWWEEI